MVTAEIAVVDCGLSMSEVGEKGGSLWRSLPQVSATGGIECDEGKGRRKGEEDVGECRGDT